MKKRDNLVRTITKLDIVVIRMRIPGKFEDDTVTLYVKQETIHVCIQKFGKGYNISYHTCCDFKHSHAKQYRK